MVRPSGASEVHTHVNSVAVVVMEQCHFRDGDFPLVSIFQTLDTQPRRTSVASTRMQCSIRNIHCNPLRRAAPRRCTAPRRTTFKTPRRTTPRRAAPRHAAAHHAEPRCAAARPGPPGRAAPMIRDAQPKRMFHITVDKVIRFISYDSI